MLFLEQAVTTNTGVPNEQSPLDSAVSDFSSVVLLAVELGISTPDGPRGGIY